MNAFLGSLIWLPFYFLLSACGGHNQGNGETKLDASSQRQYPQGLVEPKSCHNKEDGLNWLALQSLRCHRLSDYGLFESASNPRIKPAFPGVKYLLNSELFTDHANKYRFLFLPQGKKIKFVENEVLDFPLGAVLVKTFALPASLQNIKSQQDKIIEVRILSNTEKGWLASTYRWDNDLNDGFWILSGDAIEFEINTAEGLVRGEYKVPTHGQCNTCHNINGEIFPIGPKIRNLNRVVPGLTDVLDEANPAQNQLKQWHQLDLISDFPAIDKLPHMPSWQDSSQSLKDRAKAYLDINCAHCHRAEGSASLSGLSLEYWRKNLSHAHGVCNSSHGWRGGGFDIWPGDGKNSSIPLRMSLSGAPDRMPPLGRSIVDTEAIVLIRQWITSMPYQECAEQND